MAKRRTMKRRMTKRMTKRRMSKTRKGIKKMIRKSRKMRGGDISDYLPNFLTGRKPQQPSQSVISDNERSVNSSFGSSGSKQQPGVVSEEFIDVDSKSSSIL